MFKKHQSLGNSQALHFRVFFTLYNENQTTFIYMEGNNMFNRTRKQIVINANQWESFTNILESWFMNLKRTQRFLVGVTRLKAADKDEAYVVDLVGIRKDSYSTLLTKLNKYGVKVYA